MKAALNLFPVLLAALAIAFPGALKPARATVDGTANGAVHAAIRWDGPTRGPRAQAGKKVTFISQDLRNGGITGAYRGFSEASKLLGWRVRLVDGKGEPAHIRAEIARALHAHQDAVLLGGFQLDGQDADLVGLARQAGVVLAGWHAAAEPGPTEHLFVNVASSSAAVARLAADYTIESIKGDIGVVIFNDSRFAVANAKTRYMRARFRQCRRCTLLAVEDMPISSADTAVPRTVPRLDQTYGKRWTHTLAINDAYFDSMNAPLLASGRPDIQNIAAGDGSSVALGRIRAGKSQQVATVAEPLSLQGWQLADELNRAFAGAQPSGYVSRPILITTPLLRQLRGAPIDSGIPYREVYSAIWRGKVGR